MTGSEPGMPVQTGQQRVFGSPPKAFRHPQNILLSVKSSACTSIPITASYSGIKRIPELRLAAHVSDMRIQRVSQFWLVGEKTPHTIQYPCGRSNFVDKIGHYALNR